MKNLMLATLATAVLLSSCESNRTETTDTTTTTTDTTVDTAASPAGMADTAGTMATDVNGFLMDAADGNMAEIAHGKLAAQKATNAQVKEFAQMMTTDHGNAASEMKQLADRKNVNLPADMSQKHKDMQDRLSKLSGAEFDREYMNHMVAHHQETVAKFRTASESMTDADVKAFAAKMLPNLETHLQKAQEIQSQVAAK